MPQKAIDHYRGFARRGECISAHLAVCPSVLSYCGVSCVFNYPDIVVR